MQLLKTFLTADARALVPAEGCTRNMNGSIIDPDIPGLDPLRRPVSRHKIPGPDGRGQAKLDTIDDRHHLVFAAPLHGGKHGPEDLFARHGVMGQYVAKDGGLNEISTLQIGRSPAPVQNARPFAASLGNVEQAFLVLRLIDQRAHCCLHVRCNPRLVPLGKFDRQRLQKFFVNTVMDEEPGQAAT